MLRLVIKSLISNKSENYRRLDNNIRAKDNQRGDIESDRLIEHDKCIGLDKTLMQNEMQILKITAEL